MSRTEDQKVFIVADYLIMKAGKAGIPITNKLLQKLLYYSQAWFYVLKKDRLFNSRIEAWVHGPVVPKIFRKYSALGWHPITMESVRQTDFNALTLDETKVIDEVFDIYAQLGADYLEALTHREEPWISARQGLLPFETSNNAITVKSMGEYYGKKLEQARASKA